MVDVLDKIKNMTFVVNGGSGVLVQAMTKDYSYVITAKHIIQVDKYLPENGILSIDDISIYAPDDMLILARSVHPHPTLDIAIVLVDFIETSIKLYECALKFDDSLVLFGYPNFNETHRNLAIPRREWIESYGLNVIDTTNKKTKMRISEDAQHSDIEGFSGGGVFKVEGGEVYLVGIENEVLKAGDYVNRVVSIPINNVNTIIENANLALIKPTFFGDLSELKPEIFKIDNCFSPVDVKKATDILKSSSEALLQNCEFSPVNVLDEYKEIISTLSDVGAALEAKEFWIAFLEFLYVKGLLSPEALWNEDFLKHISSSYKFVYVDSRQGWKTHLPKILSIDVDHLKSGGKLLLVDFGPMPSTPDQLNYYRDNIPSNVANGIEEESIAHVESMIQKSISIIHLPKLHEHCINDREDELAELNKITQRDEIMSMILDSYSEYLVIEEIDSE